jgi:hypothetical protein
VTQLDGPQLSVPSADSLDDETIVRATLALNGVTPSESEIAGLVAAYAGTRAMVAMLYAVPGVRYEEPAVIFSARP